MNNEPVNRPIFWVDPEDRTAQAINDGMPKICNYIREHFHSEFYLECFPFQSLCWATKY